MEENQQMEGRIIEAVELIGLVPKIMQQGGITASQKARIDKIMSNFTRTKENMQLLNQWTTVDNERYNQMAQAYKMLAALPQTRP